VPVAEDQLIVRQDGKQADESLAHFLDSSWARRRAASLLGMTSR
jgi:hypothetical protein